MAQHDMNIANQGFPATRADLNNALQALVSNSSGTSAPSTTFANQWWYDTTNNKMYIRNEANNAWIEVFTLDQTNNEWQLTTGVVQAKDSDGLALKTDDGTTRLFIKDSDGSIGLGTSSPSDLLELSGSTAQPAIRLTDEDVSGLYHRIFTPTNTGLAISADAGDVAANSFLRFDVDGSEAMRIDSDGNIGIGGTPTNASDHNSLALFGNANNGAGFIEFNDTSGNADAAIFVDDGNLFINADYDNATASSSIRFRVDGSSEKMRIDSDGNLLLGTTTTVASNVIATFATSDSSTATSAGSGAALAIKNTDTTDNNYSTLYFVNSAGGIDSAIYGVHEDADGTGTSRSGELAFATANTGGGVSERMRIESNGFLKCAGVYNQSAADSANVVVDSAGNIYRSTSALKYKQDIRDIESIDIDRFRPVRYKSNLEKDDNTKDHFGFIADEVHDDGLTELVAYGVNPETEETEVEGFRYDRMTVILTKVVQEQKATIETQATQIADLITRVEALEG